MGSIKSTMVQESSPPGFISGSSQIQHHKQFGGAQTSPFSGGIEQSEHSRMNTSLLEQSSVMSSMFNNNPANTSMDIVDRYKNLFESDLAEQKSEAERGINKSKGRFDSAISECVFLQNENTYLLN